MVQASGPLRRPADQYDALADGDVDVWRVGLRHGACRGSVSDALLTESELEIFDASNRRGPRWLLRSFTPMPGFHAALAIGTPAIELRFWQSG